VEKEMLNMIPNEVIVEMFYSMKDRRDEDWSVSNATSACHFGHFPLPITFPLFLTYMSTHIFRLCYLWTRSGGTSFCPWKCTSSIMLYIINF
jgi:hypothetical protein